ncbi:MAG: sigma-54-dependent Fis family transcriptional regulator [Planctomycetes bacterium]|nr:sigma-54-dependent Fis family transcriptional regulator [Planctomycetota bacterium]
MARILVTEDESVMRSLLAKALAKWGHEATLVESAEEALQAYAPRRFDLVLTDLCMPGDDGLSLLDALRDQEPGLPVVIMTAYGSIKTAVDAVRRGASDFLAKPFDLAHLRLVLERSLNQRAQQAEIERLRPLADEREGLGDLIGSSLPMRQVYGMVDKVAPTELTVLLLGETGTGKELCARAIHAHSRRAGGRFQVVNCAAFQATLLESELFGHEKGAFTGANQLKVGHFEAAHGGTLFLDEIGEASPEVQSKLLRALQEREITRVGGTTPIKVDVRVVAATNRDLEQEVASKAFREDLYYRLAAFPIELPPLRKRADDVRVLANHLLAENQHTAGLSPEAELALSRYEWPGNVRQLQNVLQRAALLAGDAPLTLEHLKLPVSAAPGVEDGATQEGLFGLPLRDAREGFERVYLRRLLQRCSGNVSAAARAAGVGRASLHEKLNKLGLDADEFR